MKFEFDRHLLLAYLRPMVMLRLLIILILIIVGIRQKLFVGYLLALAGIVTPFLFGFGVASVAKGVGMTFISTELWQLIGAIVAVTVLGQLLKQIGALSRLTSAAQELAGGKRTATAVLPSAIGLLPMPGGALLSAPLIQDVLKEDNKPPQLLAAANYWFRHSMEFFWPLYPAIILGAGIVGLPVRVFSTLGIVMSVAMFSVGYIFFLRAISGQKRSTRTLRSVWHICLSLWPVFLAVFIALVFKLHIVVALTAAILTTVVVYRVKWSIIWSALKEAAIWRIFFMVLGIMLFKNMLELSGAVGHIPDEVTRLGIPPAIAIFVVAFLSGILSGMMVAFVGLSFPVLAGFLYIPQINLGHVFLTYLSGYLGMILSPTHLCLLLSADYFKAELGRIYRVFLPPILTVALIGFLLYVLGYPWNLIVP